jgi:hypothetical protein
MQPVSKSSKHIQKRGTLSKYHYAIICLAVISIIVGLSIVLKSSATSLELNLSVSKIVFHTPAYMSTREVAVSVRYAPRRIENVRWLESSTANLVRNRPTTITAGPSSLRISTLPISSGTWVSIENYLNAGFSIGLKAKNDRSTVSAVQSDSNVFLLARNGPNEVLSLPSSNGPEKLTIGFDNLTAPLLFVFEQVERSNTCSVENTPDFFAPNLQGVPIDAVSFSSEESPSLSIFLSSLVSGSLKMPYVEKSFSLSRGDKLRLKLRSAEIKQLSLYPCYIKIAMSAVAEEIFLGSEDRLLDLRPTYLEMAFKQPSLGFVVSCIVTLWGFLWGLKELFVPSKEK